MLLAKSALLLAFQLAPFLPGTVSAPVKAMYMTSLASWPLLPVRCSLGKQRLPKDREASPVEVPPLVSPQIP